MDKKRPGRLEVKSIIEDNIERIGKLRRQGYTEEQCARAIGVSSTSFEKYKKQIPALVEELKKSKEKLIEDLEDSLYRKALGKCTVKTTKKYVDRVPDGKGGYKEKSKIEETVQELAPDTGALCFCLKNLCPERWKEMRDVNFSDLETRLANMKSFSERAQEVEKESEEINEESPV